MKQLFSGFALGMRVVDEPHHRMPPARFLDLLFAALSPDQVRECDLHICGAPEGVCDPEPVYIIILSNLSLKRSKQLYQRIVQNKPLTSCLSIYRPFVQNNYLGKCCDIQYIGRVDEAGAVCGGERSIGSMRFCAPAPRETLKIRLRFLLAPCAYPGLTPAQAARRLTRAVASRFPDAIVDSFPLSDGGVGALDAFLYHRGGRYVPCRAHDPLGKKITANYGILSDYAAVIEAAQIRRATGADGGEEALHAGSYGVGELLLGALTAKCKRVYLCVDGETMADDGAGFMRALGMSRAPDGAHMLVDAARVHPNLRETTIVVLSDMDKDGRDTTGIARMLTPFARVEQASAVETLLAQGSFDHKLRETTIVFSGIGRDERGGAVAEQVMARVGAHCKKAMRQLVQIDPPAACGEEDAARTFEDAALDAIARMKFENWFIALTAEIVPVSGERRAERR